MVGCLRLRDLPLSAHHSFGQGRSPENPQSTDMPCLGATLHPSLVMHLGSVEHSYSDLPKSSALPAAEDTGRRHLGESLWWRFLVDESGSILEAGVDMWGLEVTVIGDFNAPMRFKA